ncbi:hypothetical protein AB4Y63_17700 [Leifsonia sp. YAF41]|uniref:hypothetical protein n=1 Tax=Leifsonia sp. YAF41 TaxID=3233086 RepID=UPI003F95B305
MKVYAMVWHGDNPEFVEFEADDYSSAVKRLRALVDAGEDAVWIDADDDFGGD